VRGAAACRRVQRGRREAVDLAQLVTHARIGLFAQRRFALL
jgi:hypothetical protein